MPVARTFTSAFLVVVVVVDAEKSRWERNGSCGNFGIGRTVVEEKGFSVIRENWCTVC